MQASRRIVKAKNYSERIKITNSLVLKHYYYTLVKVFELSDNAIDYKRTDSSLIQSKDRGTRTEDFDF